jgi:hypothetical protein
MVGDVPLAGVGVAALVLSASIGASAPADLASAPEEAKSAIAVVLVTVTAVYAAVMASIYGSFRYTIDRRTGVLAQRATLQPRRWGLAARVPFTALGGALVASAAMLGGRVSLAASLGLRGVDVGVVAATLIVGAAAAVWGLGVGLLVRAHLPSLFVAAFSLSVALVIGPFWPGVAAWLPLAVLLRSAGLDLTFVGISAAVGPAPGFAVALGIICTAGIVTVGAWAFLRRDL